MQRAIAALSPNRGPERRIVDIRMAFRVPGARAGFEAVTRAVSEGRDTVDCTLLSTDPGRLLEDFVFIVDMGDRTATLLLRQGFVTDEFIDLARTENRTDVQERRLDELKAQRAQRVMSARGEDL